MIDPEETQTLVFRKAPQDAEAASPFPEDLRQWRSAVVLARHVREALGQPPDTAPDRAAIALPAVLLWCLATGRYSSTDIVALCAEEPMGRHLGGGLTFVWGDIRRWRREHRREVAAALARLLQLCRPPSGTGSRLDCAAEAERRLELAAQADHADAEG